MRRSGARFLDIERVVAIKVAPFNRYRTLDVSRGVAESGRTDVALYTGNDDAIVADLVTPFPSADPGKAVHVPRRAARPMGGRDETRRRAAGPVSGRRRRWRGVCRRDPAAARARRRAHRSERRAVRPRARFRRMHSRHPRSAAAPGPARRPVVPRSARGTESRPDGRDRSGARPLSAPDGRRVHRREPRSVDGVVAN